MTAGPTTNCGCTAGAAGDPTSKNAGLPSVTPSSSSADDPPTVAGTTDTTRAPVPARLTAAWRLLAASRRGSTCSECVAPAQPVNPTTTATSTTEAATGIRTPGTRRAAHQAAPATSSATGQATHGDHHPS